MMTTDKTSKLASLFLIFLFLGNDFLATANSIAHFPSLISKSQNHTVFVKLEPLPQHNNQVTTAESRKPRSVKASVASPAPDFVEYASVLTDAYLGDHISNATKDPAGHIFDIPVGPEAELFNYAYLSYEISGLSDGAQIPKAINSSPAYMGGNLQKAEGWQSVDFPLSTEDLNNGLNQVRFNLPLGFNFPVQIRNVKLVFTNEEIVEVEGPRVKRYSTSPEEFQVLIGDSAKPLPSFSVVDIDMPSIPTHIVNVSKNNWGYFMEGADDQLARISVGVDREKVQKGADLKEVQLFYFDKRTRSWAMAMSTHIDLAGDKVEGTVPQGTNYFAGLIKTPDMPEAAGYLPTAISDIQAANPATEMNIMQPPGISNTGEASISYPLDIPAGRAGMTPKVALSYSSDAGTGWMGMGWNVHIPQVCIDTRWGVPTFKSEAGVNGRYLESESYVLNGKSLSMEGEYKSHRPKIDNGVITFAPPLELTTSTTRFFERTMSSYKEIRRHGADPTSFFWVETLANQTKHYYGSLDGENLDATSVLTDANGNIIKWFLTRVVDKWGNNITYSYQQGTDASGDPVIDGGKWMVPSQIEYTGYQGSTNGKYKVEFVSDGGRYDATTSFKFGVKLLDDRKLEGIRVYYNGNVIKQFVFDYRSGQAADFFKTLLVSIKEHRNLALFTEHTFDYHPGTLTYGNPQTIETDHFDNQMFNDMGEEIVRLASPLNAYHLPSPIKTTSTTGWSAGGSLGAGIVVSASGAVPTKTFTFSGRLSYSETYNKDRISLNDFNGDGLPDLVYDKGRGAKYYPLRTNSSGDYEFGEYNRINTRNRLMKSKSKAWNYGFDFVMPLNVFYFGMNWSNGRSKTTTYLTDYNADGIKDLVSPNGDKAAVRFGTLTPQGDIVFSNSSENTLNPILKDATPNIVEEEDEKLADFEIVKIWEAPFAGTVDISGTAEMSASAPNGEVSIGIQHNDDFIVNMTTVTTSSTAMTYNSLTVAKGDKLMFRTRAGDDGREDLLSWDPKVTYQSPNANRKDANGMDYSESSYDDGFLLSGLGGPTFQWDQALKVLWPGTFSVSALTDDLILKIKVIATNSSGAISSTYSKDYQYVVPAGSTQSPVPTDFKEIGQSTAPSFLSSFATVPTSNSSMEYHMVFEVSSSSNVDWASINWRPEVQFEKQGCSTVDESTYPVVQYKTYNRLVKLDATLDVTSITDPASKLRAWPIFDPAYSSNLSQLFKADELASSSSINKTAYLVAKNDGKLLQKIALQISNSGALTYYKITPDGELGTVITYNHIDNDLNFLRSEVVDGELFVGLFAENESMGEFLDSYVTDVRVYKETSPGTMAIKVTVPDFNIFSRDINELQDNLLHWGQFCWNQPTATEIAVADLEMAIKTFAENNDYSDGQAPGANDFDALDNEDSDDSELNPLNQKFFMLIPTRGEDTRNLRTYIKDHEPTLTAENYDRWSAWGLHTAIYGMGVTAPGVFPEEVADDNSLLPFVVDDYGAYATFQGSKSKAIGLSMGATIFSTVQLAGSTLIGTDSKYFTEGTNAFMDINGDGYPDILGANNINAYLTSPTGGHGAYQTFGHGTKLSKSVPISGGVSVSGKTSAGQHKNQDPRFMSMSGSANFRDDRTKIAWADMNGDGLVDRLYEVGSVLLTSFNAGDELLTGVDFPLNSLSSLYGSSTNTYGLGVGLGIKEAGGEKGKNGNSFAAGIGVNSVSSHSDGLMIDFNGDGLTDRADVVGTDLNIYLNNGTELVLHSTAPIGTDKVNVQSALGVYGQLAGTIAIPTPLPGPAAVLAIKLSISLNGQVNYAINELKQSFIDVNGDGVPDFVEATDEGNLKVSFAQVNEANLLSKVTNPIRGSFSIDYKRVGNKYGAYPVEIELPSTKTDEKMIWDMPESKWVMAKLTIDDGLDVVNGSADLDGQDQLIYTYNYDGGLKSRRERDFLGFTRVQTVHPANMQEPIANGKNKEHLSEVVQYKRAKNNDPDYRRRFEYFKGIPTDVYTLHHIEELSVVDVNGSNVETYEFSAKLVSHEENEYQFLTVNQDPAAASFNRLTAHEEYDWERANLSLISESACLFPALTSTKTTSIPQTATDDKFHQVEYKLKYDDYLNVIEYSNEGISSPGTITTQVVDTVVHTHFEYEGRGHLLSDLVDGIAPYDVPDFVTADGSKCFIIGPITAGFSTDTLCLPAHWIDDPCDLLPEPDGQYVYTTHRKLVEEVQYVEEDVYNASYSGRIIAQMDYFTPASAASQTNMLQRHRIYLGSVPSGLERDTEVGQLHNGLAPKLIWNHLDASTKAETEITYSSKGNITKIKGPQNHALQRLETDFTYDSDVEQFVTAVSNSYGDNACFKYDPATGNLLKYEDINGHPTQYEYDDLYRLESVWAPRDLENSTNAASISFEYYPLGIDPTGTDPYKRVPVAFTNHAVNGSVSDGGTPPGLNPDPPTPTVDCSTLTDVSSRPAMNNPLQTATFIDGAQRVVQIKKDVPKRDNTSWNNIRQREVSGLVAIDSIGREVELRLSVEETIGGSVDLGQFNNSLGTLVKETVYDYANRPILADALQENSHWSRSLVSYDWDNLINGTNLFYTEQTLTGTSGISSKVYVDAWDRTIYNVLDPAGVNAKSSFVYDALNQITSTKDPLDVETTYEYDRFGRIEYELHDDRGLSSYQYDLAGNVTKLGTSLSGSNGIVMTYNYNRLDTKTLQHTPEVSDVVYTYGSLGDGANGAGRVTRVVQGSNYKTENFKYDELGNLISEEKIIKVPQAGQRTFNTTFAYDSWGRILNISYPDGDLVTYQYNNIGELQSILSTKGSNIQSIVDDIVYDGFGNLAAIKYGNGAETSFSYDIDTRRMDQLELVSNSNTLLDKTFSYDDRGNVDEMQNTAGQVLGMGGTYKMDYGYDGLNRLLSTTGDYNGNINAYQLDMTYDKAGSISTKDQGYLGTTMDYDLEYFYDGTKKHRLIRTKDHDNLSALDLHYEYNSMGSLTGIYEVVSGSNSYKEEFQWTEEQSLMGAENDAGIHHYTYDHNGERILKSSVRELGVYEGGELVSTYLHLDPYIVYVNPYFVATHYSADVEASKHYYMGAQRVATELINYPFVAEEETGQGGGSQPESTGGTYGATINLKAVLSGFGKVDGVDYQINSLLTMHAISHSEYDDYDQFLDALDAINGGEGTPCEEDPPCVCELSRYWAYTLYSYDCSDYRLMYWYHPDYLGNTEFITDLSGDPYQYFFYSPWGESLEDQHKHDGLLTFFYDSPYRFNAKELDFETGNYYYGARYYKPSLSVWLSVDPLSHLDPDKTPYHFTENNPVMLVDPDGRSTHTDADGNVVAVYDDGDLGVYKHHDLSDWDGESVLEREGDGVTHMGETYYWDEFISPESGEVMPYKIQFGKSFDPHIDELHKKAEEMDLVEIAMSSRKGQPFDIKNDYKAVGGLLQGKYVSSRSAGNYLAGYNAQGGTYYGIGIGFITFQKLAGALHIENSHDKPLSRAQMKQIVLWGNYDNCSDPESFVAPTYGEVQYQYRMSRRGWYRGANE